jgi:hypothetical protein
MRFDAGNRVTRSLVSNVKGLGLGLLLGSVVSSCFPLPARHCDREPSYYRRALINCGSCPRFLLEGNREQASIPAPWNFVTHRHSPRLPVSFAALLACRVPYHGVLEPARLVSRIIASITVNTLYQRAAS